MSSVDVPSAARTNGIWPDNPDRPDDMEVIHSEQFAIKFCGKLPTSEVELFLTRKQAQSLYWSLRKHFHKEEP